MGSFQKTIRANQAAAIPGTLVEASDTYKYVIKGITADNTCEIGWFVSKDSNGKYHKTKATDTSVAGIVLFDKYYTSDVIDNPTVPTGTDIVIVENGVVAVALPSGFAITSGATMVVLNTTTGVLSIKASAGSNEVDTGWRMVQAPATPLPGIAFLKK